MPGLMEELGALRVDARGAQLAVMKESQWLERKSARTQARDLASHLVGFANAEGGVLVIGVQGGRVEGIRTAPPGRQNDWRQAASDHTQPPVRARFEHVAVRNREGDADEVLIILVEPSDRVHTTRGDEAYLRIGDETRRLTYGQRQELEYDKGQNAFEASPARDAGWENLDEALLGQFAERVGHPDPRRLLAARGLLNRDDQVTVAALLLFGRAPQSELPEAFVRVLRYRGTERGTGRRQQIVTDLRAEGPLPEQITRVQQHVSDLLPRRRALGADGRFSEVGAIPQPAWLEAVVNAVTHRSYSMMGDHVRVEVFDDRLEVESPGRFPGIIDINNLESVRRFARNPRVARALADLGFGQELGEGIRRMFEEMRLAGLAEPEYRQTSGSVRVVLPTDPVDRELEDRLPAHARALVRAIRDAGRASTGELMELTRRSRPVVLRSCRALEDAGLVEWVGTSRQDPRAYWRLREG